MLYPSVIADYMEPTGSSIGLEETLGEAKQLLQERDAHCVLVCEQGKPYGVLTEQEMQLARRMGARDDQKVGELMGLHFYPVLPTTPLAHVVRTMRTHNYQSALVLEDGHVKGVFTRAHALQALSDLLEAQPQIRDGIGAGEVRAVVLTEHLHVSTLLAHTRAAARTALGTSAGPPALHRLHERAERLLLAMQSHLDLEDRALAPALADLPGYGKERAAQLVAEHRQQTEETEAIVRELAKRDEPAPTLARKLDELLGALELDLIHEEELLLNTDLLRDDGIVTECTAG